MRLRKNSAQIRCFTSSTVLLGHDADMAEEKKRAWWLKPRVWWSLIAAGVLLFIGLSIAAILWVPGYFVSSAIQSNPAAPGAKAQTVDGYVTAVTNARQGVLFIVGGVIAIVTLLISLARHELDRDKQELDRDANRTTRYTEAVKQLGDDSLAVRLGGIYALERIAQDSARDRQTILDVLCSYLRDKSLFIADEPGTGVITMKIETAAAAATVLGRINSLPHQNRLNLRRTQLTGLDLTGADFTIADLTDARLNGADLTGAFLVGADLNRADLTGAFLVGADLNRADLTGAFLAGANLTDADLNEAFVWKLRDLGGRTEMKPEIVTREYLMKNGAVGIDTVMGLPAR